MITYVQKKTYKTFRIFSKLKAIDNYINKYGKSNLQVLDPLFLYLETKTGISNYGESYKIACYIVDKLKLNPIGMNDSEIVHHIQKRKNLIAHFNDVVWLLVPPYAYTTLKGRKSTYHTFLSFFPGFTSFRRYQMLGTTGISSEEIKKSSTWATVFSKHNIIIDKKLKKHVLLILSTVFILTNILLLSACPPLAFLLHAFTLFLILTIIFYTHIYDLSKINIKTVFNYSKSNKQAESDSTPEASNAKFEIVEDPSQFNPYNSIISKPFIVRNNFPAISEGAQENKSLPICDRLNEKKIHSNNRKN